MTPTDSPKKKDELLQLRVEKEFADQLAAVAKTKHIPVSTMIRVWISERLGDELLGAKNQVNEWQKQRLSAIRAEIMPNLPTGPVLVIHARPLTPGVEIDGSKLRDTQGTLVPLRYTLPATGRITQTGYRVKREAGKQTVSEGQIFKTGQVENVSEVPFQGQEINGIALDRAIFEITHTFVGVLAGQQVPLPYHLSVTLLDAKGYWLVVSDSFMSMPHVAIEKDCITLPEIIVTDFSQSQTVEAFGELIKPTLDELWQASGLKESLSYSQDGKWRKH